MRHLDVAPKHESKGTHHSMFELNEGVRGWFRISNEGVVKSIWVEQPDGSRRLFIPYKLMSDYKEEGSE